MKLFEKKFIAKIAQDDISDAKLSSNDFEQEIIKKRAFINVLGARLAMKLLFSQKIEANNIYSLYTIHSVLREMDLADIYYQGIKIDVRLVFNNKEIFIPRAQFDTGLLPDVYLILQLKEDFSSAEFLGFFEPEAINKNNANKEFFFFEEERLHKPEEFKKFLESYVRVKDFHSIEENIEEDKLRFVEFIDGDMSKSEKLQLLQKLSTSFSLREKLVEFENFEILSNAAAQNDELIMDSTLSIVGSQKLFENDSYEESFESFMETASEDGLDEVNQEQEKTDKSHLASAGLLAAAAGLELGAEVVKASSSAAEASANVQSEALNAAGEILSSGIDAGSDFVESMFDNELPDFSLTSESNEAETILEEQEVPDFHEFNIEDDSSDEVFEINLDEPDSQVTLEDGFISDETFDSEEIITEFDNEIGLYQEVSTPEPVDFDEITEIGEIEEEINEDSEELFEDFVELETAEQEVQEDIIEDETVLEESLESPEPLTDEESESDIEISPETQVEILQDTELEPESEIELEAELTPELEVTIEPELEAGLTPALEVEPEFKSEPEDIDFSHNVIEETSDEELSQELLDENVLQELPSLDEIDKTEDLLMNFDEAIDFNLSDENSFEQEEESTEEVIDADNFDFNLLTNDEQENIDDKVENNEETIAFDTSEILNVEENTEIKPQDEDSDTIEKFRALEEQEYLPVTEEYNQEQDDFISQVDEFLNDINISSEKRALLGSSLAEQASEAIFPSIQTDEQIIESDIALPKVENDNLQVLFNENKPEEIGLKEIDFTTPRTSTPFLQNKKMVIAASVAGVVLASTIMGTIVINSKSSTNNLAQNTQPALSTEGEMASQTGTDTTQDNLGADLSQPIEQAPVQDSVQNIPGEDASSQTANPDMGKAVSDAFLSEPVNANVSKVAWEVPEDLAYNDSFRKYLQIAGKNLKLNLQNNLLLATEMAYSNKTIVDLTIGSNGDLQASNVVISSGSKQIDKIVLQSVKETLKYLKVPSSELGGQSFNATLIINF